MCRFVYYQGPPIVMSSLVTEPCNSLIHQSYHAHERREPLNGDGFGVAWYAPDVTPVPGHFRSITPAWSNRNLSSLARVVQTPCLAAHVRAASPGIPVEEFNCHPFVHGSLAFMHNGRVAGFRRLRRALLAELSDRAFEGVEGTTDSEYVFALLRDRLGPLEESPGLDELEEALRWTIERILHLTRDRADGEVTDLNMVLTTGRCCLATRFTTDPESEGETLHVQLGTRYGCTDGRCRMEGNGRPGGAVIVSSERLSNDPGWEMVPRNHLVRIDADGVVESRPLGTGRPHAAADG